MRKFVRCLSEKEREYFAPYFNKATLEQAQIIENHTPFWLRKSMCAVVIGRRVYFKQGVYQANTPCGVTLLAHELTHVEQFLTGMTVFKYLWASRYGYQKNPYEIEAYERADAVCHAVMQRYQLKA